MLDVKKLAETIINLIKEPLQILSNRLKTIEDINSKMEPVVLDLMKYTGRVGELENVARALAARLDEVSNSPLIISGIDPKQIFTGDQVRELVERLIAQQPEIKIFSIDDAKPLIDDAVAKQVAAIELPELPELPDVPKLIKEIADAIPKPKDGTSVTVTDVKPIIEELVAKQIAAIELPKLPDIDEIVAKEVAAIELPKLPDIDKMINEGIKEAVAAIELPTAPELPNIESMIHDSVKEFFTGFPVPKDGKGVTVDDVRPLIEELVAKFVANIPPPKDGIGVTSGVIDREGCLILTTADGKSINLGPVVGRDVDMEAVEKLLAEKVAAIPRPKDGLDGLGFDDLNVEFDGQRTITLIFEKGEKRKEFKLKQPNIIYRDVYEIGKEYELGDLVTWGGSLWHCNKEASSSRPGENGDWTLAAKRGRNGKEVVILPKGPKKPVKKEE